MRVTYKAPVIDYAKRRPSQTLPDQSMSIQEIVKRFVRGIPVDVQQRKGVFMDQTEHDFEKLSRMDFAEKAELAQQLADQANTLQNELAEAQAQRREAQAEAARMAAEKARQPNPAKPEA